MSAEHPTPWKVGYWQDLDGSTVYDDDEPIHDANGNPVIKTDNGVYPPDRETVEEMVAAMNQYKGPRFKCELYDSEDEAFAAYHESLKDGDVVGYRGLLKFLYSPAKGGAGC